MTEVLPKRPVRSFVRRQGRMTPSQKHGVTELMQQYGVCIEDGSIASWVSASPRLVLEIGFGMGEGLYHYASHESHNHFLGIEVHQPGVGRLLNQIDEQQLDNIKVCMQDAKDVLEKVIADSSLDRVQIFFPDPWPKKKHHKRRIVQVSFIQLLMKKLKPQGVVHLATDWQEYYEHMLEVMDSCMLPADGSISEPLIAARPKTRFEQRGIRLGHTIHDLVYVQSPQI